MGPWLLGIVMVIYLGIAVSYYLQGRIGMCGAFVGYAVSNLFFIWDAITGGK